jgi:DNA invertase Pin-like site-specific DNA recombinase
MRKASSRSNDGTAGRKTVVRCAIYTRKSSEEGLEQDFNSLDAQREACEAYVASQRSEGWIASPKMYDDGGFSGGTMERPALKALLADIREGLVDTVVVYKVDRLTRSLGDFAKIVDVFDAAGASFVSVTQSFNTTTSMGRLTLNMLLSFAQFEREVTGERIRDKIAASKAKGMWMGGKPPLGYEVRDRKLEIVEGEAETVRHIFRRYAELGSVLDLRDELAAAGIQGKTIAGREETEGPKRRLDRGALYHLLQNRLYRGEIAFKGKVYPGQHDAIVDEELWTAVADRLSNNRAIRRHRSTAASPSLLAGLIRDGEGIPLTPTHAVKKGRRYRYYVSHDLIVRRAEAGDDSLDGSTLTDAGAMGGVRRSSARRIPAADVEAAVEGRIVAFLGATAEIDNALGPHARDIDERRHLHQQAEVLASGWERQPALDKTQLIRNLLAAVVLEEEAIRISMGLDRLLLLLRQGPIALQAACADADPASSPASDNVLDLTVAARLKRVGMEMKLLIDEPGAQHQRKPDRSLVRLLAQARRYRELLMARGNRTITELAEAEGVIPSYFTRILRLVWLAPDITDAILDGRQPIELSAKRLSAMSNLPPDWPAQRAALGFNPRS